MQALSPLPWASLQPLPGGPYLCATLPFLMSEMTRGSPRLLLAAGGKKPKAHPWPPALRRAQGWVWTQSPTPRLTAPGLCGL